MSNNKTLDFGFFYKYYIAHIHRKFNGTDKSLIALFCVKEFLHNFHDFVEYKNYKALYPLEENCPGNYSINWYRIAIKCLKNGEPDFFLINRPVFLNYIEKRKWFWTKKKWTIFLKDVSKEILNMLTSYRNLLKLIEDNLDSDVWVISK